MEYIDCVWDSKERKREREKESAASSVSRNHHFSLSGEQASPLTQRGEGATEREMWE